MGFFSLVHTVQVGIHFRGSNLPLLESQHHAMLGSQCDESVRLNVESRLGQNPEALENRSGHDDQFLHREVIADAGPWSGSKRKVDPGRGAAV